MNSKQPLNERPSGVGSNQLMKEEDRYRMVFNESKRQFNHEQEVNRKIHYSHMQVKDQNFYNQYGNLWNETQRLHPKKFAIYSEKNLDPATTFKHTIVDHDGII